MIDTREKGISSSIFIASPCQYSNRVGKICEVFIRINYALLQFLQCILSNSEREII